MVIDKNIVTSEYVSIGNSDRVADLISDAILDKFINFNDNTTASIKTMVKDDVIVVSGEVDYFQNVNINRVVLDVLTTVGYLTLKGYSEDRIKVINLLSYKAFKNRSGGVFSGYASNETYEYLPLGTYISREICNYLDKDFEIGNGKNVKVQTVLEYHSYEHKPIVKSIIIGLQHKPSISIDTIRDRIVTAIKNNDRVPYHSGSMLDDDVYVEYIKDKPIAYIITSDNIDVCKCGISGNKLISSQYGGNFCVNGSGFSGKDIRNVDRLIPYMCRYLAKNIVDAGLSEEAKVELEYGFDCQHPCSLRVELIKQCKTPIRNLSKQIEKYITKNVELNLDRMAYVFFPYGIKSVFYNATYNGSFGHNNDTKNFPWEKLDISEKLKNYIEEVELSLNENKGI